MISGIPNSRKSGQNILQDGTRVIYFDKTQHEGGSATDAKQASTCKFRLLSQRSGGTACLDLP